MSLSLEPFFGELDRATSEGLLRRNHVGRIAFAFHERVDIEPIHYVFADEWVFGRTSPGMKVNMLQHHPWVAFEVDEIESAVEWRSVVVHGTVYFLSPGGGDREREAYETAVRHLRSFYPEALTGSDAVPARTVLFRIHADEVTGRYATTKE